MDRTAKEMEQLQGLFARTFQEVYSDGPFPPGVVLPTLSVRRLEDGALELEVTGSRSEPVRCHALGLLEARSLVQHLARSCAEIETLLFKDRLLLARALGQRDSLPCVREC